MALLLLTGRGSFLIAGYNTMSKEKKAQYDTKALCKFIGKIILPIGILTPFIGVESIAHWFIWLYIAVTIALPIFAIIYVNTGNRFKVIKKDN
jgi:hypothetical protein